MSGHSKWSTIKRKKGKTDAQRGKLFSKLAREVTMAAKIGGEDPDMNPRLRLAIQKAKESNMPNDNINRAIKKGAGNDPDSNYEELTFEAYAPHSVALLVKCLTDNKNRTVSNIKAILNKAEATLASQGAVAYMFNTLGLFVFDPGTNEDAVMEAALAHPIEDINTLDDGAIEVKIAPTSFDALKATFDTAELKYASASIEPIPESTISLDTEQAKTILSLIDKLDDDDDVQDVYGNYDIADNIIDQLS